MAYNYLAEKKYIYCRKVITKICFSFRLLTGFINPLMHENLYIYIHVIFPAETVMIIISDTSEILIYPVITQSDRL